MRSHLRPAVTATLIGTLLAASASACVDATAPTNGMPITFSVGRTTGTMPTPAPTVTVAAGVLSVDGQVTTPTPCYALSGRAGLASDTVVVSVVAKSTLSGSQACEAAVQFWRYTAAVNNLPSNVAVLRVTYDPGDGKPVVILVQPLAAP